MKNITRTFHVARCETLCFDDSHQELTNREVECFWNKKEDVFIETIKEACFRDGLTFLKLGQVDIKEVVASMPVEDFFENSIKVEKEK